MKSDLADAFAAFVIPFQARVAEYRSDPAELNRILAAGSARAREVADATVERVYERVGFLV